MLYFYSVKDSVVSIVECETKLEKTKGINPRLHSVVYNPITKVRTIGSYIKLNSISAQGNMWSCSPNLKDDFINLYKREYQKKIDKLQSEINRLKIKMDNIH